MHVNAAPTVVLMGAMACLGKSMGTLVKKQIGAYSYAGSVAGEVNTVVLCISLLPIDAVKDGWQYRPSTDSKPDAIDPRHIGHRQCQDCDRI